MHLFLDLRLMNLWPPGFTVSCYVFAMILYLLQFFFGVVAGAAGYQGAWSNPRSGLAYDKLLVHSMWDSAPQVST